MGWSFTRFKDHSAGFFNAILALVNRCPDGLKGFAYGAIGFLFRLFYYVPFSYVRRVNLHLANHLDGRSPRDVYFGLIDGTIRMIRGTQALSHSEEVLTTSSLHISKANQDLLDSCQDKGAILVIPHATGSLLAVRELSKRYDLLMLVKEPKDAARAARQRKFYDKLGCETLDARRADPVTLARTILKALKAGRFVVGTCDRIRSRPPNNEAYHKYSDTVLAEILGQQVGVVGWPARFAHKCRLPILPILPAYEVDGIQLHFAEPINADGDINGDSQAWIDALWKLFCEHPEHWMFAYDKKWARLLQKSKTGGG